MKNLKVMLFKSILLVFISSVLPCLAAELDESIEKEDFNSLFNKASSYENINNDSILFYANKALQIANFEHNVGDQLNVLLLIISSEIKSAKYGDAIKHCINADIIALENNRTGKHIEILVYSGKIHQRLGFSFLAQQYFHVAQKLAEKSQYRIESNDIYHYLGSVFHDIGELNQSRKRLLLSISRSKQNRYTKRVFETYILLANIYTATDSISRYLIIAESVIDGHPELKYEKVVLRNRQGLLNNEIGNINLSENQYLEAIQISKINRFYYYLANLYNNYAYLLMTEKKYDSTNIVLGEALAIVTKLRRTDLQADILESYREYFLAIGDYHLAFSYQESSINKRKEYREQQRDQESLFLGAVIENKHKEKEILQQENEITRLWAIVLCVLTILTIFIGLTIYFRQKFALKRARLETVEKGKSFEIADALIHGQDEERKRLAMDLHDGLSAKLGALRLLVDGFFKPNDKYDEISVSLVNIHQNVRDLSHRMLPAQLEDIGLPLTIKSLVSSINKSGKFTVEFETNLNKRLPDKLKINIYHLIHELINNAIKHSSGDTIFIQLIEQDDILNLSVEDNGSECKLNDNSGGMGLKNLKTRVEYLRGKLMVETNETKTLFMIEIPTQIPSYNTIINS